MIRLLIGGSGTLNDTKVVLLLYQDLTEMISSEHFNVKYLNVPQMQKNEKKINIIF